MTEIDIKLGVSKFNNIGGVTCYMNSILAIIQQTPIFTDYIVGGLFKKSLLDKKMTEDKVNNSISYQLHKLIKISLENDNMIINPQSFRRAITMKDSMWGESMHQDSQEFLTFLFSQLENEISEKIQFIPGLNFNSEINSKLTNSSNIIMILATTQWMNFIRNEYSMIKTLFTGMTRMITTCEFCSNQSNNFDIFQTLQLSLPINTKNSIDYTKNFTLEECMDHYIEEEILDCDNKMKCNFCYRKNRSKKQTKLWKTPKILIIHIKRFNVNDFGIPTNKLCNLVTYPIENLDISNYVDMISPDLTANKTKYNLFAINRHHTIIPGSINFGHYTSIVKNRYDNMWYIFDDNVVKKISNPEQLIDNNMYMLFYYRTN
jgi:ubiquitin carboxyl-terminal hydrolase 8